MNNFDNEHVTFTHTDFQATVLNIVFLLFKINIYLYFSPNKLTDIFLHF